MSEMTYRIFRSGKPYGLYLMSERVREASVCRTGSNGSFLPVLGHLYWLMDEVSLDMHFCLNADVAGNYGVIL